MTMTLKPCPFCGNTKPTFERLGTPRQSCIVACGYCGCRNESADEGDDCGKTWNERAIEAELSKQKPVARPRLPRIDHFAREAFEKFASGVECELTNYRWFEAGWDARGDTVAAAPLPSAPDTVQVPREPTQDMLYAMAELDGWKRGDREHPMLTRWEDYWVAALAAAPKSTP